MWTIWLGSFLDQLAFVHKNKTHVFLLGLIDVFNRAENDVKIAKVINSQKLHVPIFETNRKSLHPQKKVTRYLYSWRSHVCVGLCFYLYLLLPAGLYLLSFSNRKVVALKSASCGMFKQWNWLECTGVTNMHKSEKTQQSVRYDNGDALPLIALFQY